MKTGSLQANEIIKLRKARRKSLNVSGEALIKTSFLPHGGPLPLVVRPTIEDARLISWAKAHRRWIDERLCRHGGILFRGFQVEDPEAFEQFIKAALSDELLSYVYRSTPRTRVTGKIYTSTEYPHDTAIPLHSESAYAATWPRKIVFCCLQPAAQGGNTPIADIRRVYQRLDPRLIQRFCKKGIMYVRNYAEKDLDLSWQEAFQTTRREVVETYCREEGIQCEWLAGNRLRTRQICQAVARHPQTREWVWFNQAHLFHISGLKPEVRESIVEEFGRDDLPRNAYFGDGSPIEDAALHEVRAAFDQESVLFQWERGDILMLDNMLTAHGRQPYTPPRKVLVGMAAPFHAHQLEEQA